jgi:hypothetical protein
MSQGKDDLAQHEVSNSRGFKSDNQLLMLYRISRSTGWMAFFTLVVAIGSAAYAYFFWQQLSVMRDQLDEMQELSSTFAKSLDAVNTQSAAVAQTIASLSELIGRGTGSTNQLTAAAEKVAGIEKADPLLTLDRPWVGTDSISVTPLRAARDLTIKANIRNGGRSPAINVRMNFRAATPAAKASPVGDIEECDSCARSILLPNASTSYEVTIDGSVLSADEVKRITNGTDTILLYGRIDYTNPTESHHTTMVCMTYVPSRSGFSACVSGNRLD